MNTARRLQRAARVLLAAMVLGGMFGPLIIAITFGAQVERGYGPLRALPTDEGALLRLFQDALGWGRPAHDPGHAKDVEQATRDLLKFLTEGFTAAAMAKVGTSAIESRKLGYLLDSDIIVPNKDELLYVAIQQAKAMFDSGYRAPLKRQFPVAGSYMPSCPAFHSLIQSRPGHKLGLVTIGGCHAACVEAMDLLAKEGISVEVLDPRTVAFGSAQIARGPHTYDVALQFEGNEAISALCLVAAGEGDASLPMRPARGIAQPALEELRELPGFRGEEGGAKGGLHGGSPRRAAPRPRCAPRW